MGISGLEPVGAWSPSSRRAWIEIGSRQPSSKTEGGVALLAEGVDRNWQWVLTPVRLQRSPSSRRAWIEIPKSKPAQLWKPVALLAEGVDRNGINEVSVGLAKTVALLAEGVDRNIVNGKEIDGFWCRPPRGGRG